MPMALLPPGIALPPGFDLRNLPMAPPPGMAYDPEVYKKGIRWAPVQAGNSGQGMAGKEGHLMAMIPINHPGASSNGSTGSGPWPDMQFVSPHPNVHLPQGYQPGAIPSTHSNLQRRSSSSSSSQPSQNPPSTSTASTPRTTSNITPGIAKTADSEKNQDAEPSSTSSKSTTAASGSAFNSTPLQGRTIYSAGVNSPFSNGSNDKEVRTEAAPKTVKNGESVPKDSPKSEAPKKGRKSASSKGIAK